MTDSLKDSLKGLTRGLTREQTAAVEKLSGAVLVLAPVGTGKTETMARRTAHAIQSGITPEKILCLSFTNKAATEMKQRIARLLTEFGLGKLTDEITVSTFHSLCVKILRVESELLGLYPDFTIYDDEDAKAIVQTLREKYALDVAPNAAKKLDTALKNFIETAKLLPFTTKEKRPMFDIFYEHLNASALKEHEVNWKQHFPLEEIFRDYNEIFSESRALDFTDLITYVISLFTFYPDALERWQEAYQWIQVDEVQDTSIPEYRVISLLAKKYKSLAFFGDKNQTIYEWRNSRPAKILPRFESDFAPVFQVELTVNHRSTPSILNAAKAVVSDILQDEATATLVTDADIPDTKIKLHTAETLADEAFWIAGEIKRLTETDHVQYNDIIILTRKHDLNERIAAHLRFCGVPTYLVQDSRFFLRPEVKDAVAYLKLLFNPYDSQSLLRGLKTPPKGVGDKSIADIAEEGRKCGLRLHDFLNPVTEYSGDTFSLLLERFYEGNLIFVDTETTGRNPFYDDIIELAAIKTLRSGKTVEFHRFIKPNKPVGASFGIHGISDAMLEADGVEAADALVEFLEFINDGVLIGHNVEFDIEMLRNALRRNDLAEPEFISYDTLDLVRRFYVFRDYRLTTICEELHLPKPTHRAMDDVRSTQALLTALIPKLTDTAAERRTLIATYREKFKEMSSLISRWRKSIADVRPQVVLERILEEGGIREYWYKQKDGERRLKALDELAARFQALDVRENPKESLRYILEQTALGSSSGDFTDENKVPLVTVHQAKGLEFDTVFIAGVTDNEFPHFISKNQNKITEEQRLFYVAMTRAKSRLYISHFKKNQRDFEEPVSRFVSLIPKHLIERV
jgi:DNA helicase II / ATP-dependent DNA helicase PcrA